MQLGREDYKNIQDTTVARELSLRALQCFKDLPVSSILNRVAREILHLKVDDPVCEKPEYFPDTSSHMIPFEEPVFLLRGQDMLAEKTLEFWIEQAKISGVDQYTIYSAEEQLQKIRAWYKKKKPDVRVAIR